MREDRFKFAGCCTEKQRPNIVFILSDDQAWTDYGFMGHPDIRTPHLDKLAGDSLVFERGHVAAPLCRPSLASMMSGVYPFDHGIVGNDARVAFTSFSSISLLRTAAGDWPYSALNALDR